MWYVLVEIAILLVLACLLGLIVGWMLWRWRRANVSRESYEQLVAERDGLRSANERLEADARRASAAAAVASEAGPDVPPKREPEVPVVKDTQVPPEPLSARSSSGHGEDDDLTEIPGVDDTMAAFLVTHDLTTYRALGSLTDDQVDDLQALLPERPTWIRDNDWVGHARRLYNVKYGQLRS